MAEKTENQEKTKLPKALQTLLEAGAQFGHKKSSVHPGMFRYIFGVRNNTHVIDVEKTEEKLKEALEFIDKLIGEGKTILFVGTKVPVRNLIKKTAESASMPYINIRWYGGTITNWSTISQRVEYMKDLRKKISSSEAEKYTKHERLLMQRELDKLETHLLGIQNMEKLPDALFIVDLKQESLAVKEAKSKGIPSVGIVDTNVNPEDVTYPIPANDDSVAVLELILKQVEETISKSKTKPKKQESKKTDKAKTKPKTKAKKTTKKEK